MSETEIKVNIDGAKLVEDLKPEIEKIVKDTIEAQLPLETFNLKEKEHPGHNEEMFGISVPVGQVGTLDTRVGPFQNWLLKNREEIIVTWNRDGIKWGTTVKSITFDNETGRPILEVYPPE